MLPYNFKKLALFSLCVLTLYNAKAQDTLQYVVPNRVNDTSQYNKPYVILISADGFRYDFADKYHATFLTEVSRGGVRAESMKPSFPSLTFPNHYTLATGLYPAHHGIVDNTFYDKVKNQIYAIRNKKAVKDSSWYGGTPIWVLAEQQKMLSASFYWVGSESNIKGFLPTYYYHYNEAIPIDRRIETVKNWLLLPDSIRPHLITFYLPEVDHAAHKFGPESIQTEQAVQFVDSAISKLYHACNETGLPVNFIFLSDHGMVTMDTENPITLPVKIDSSEFKMTYGSTTVHLYARDKKYIKPLYKKLKSKSDKYGYQVYLADDIPERWHYSAKDDRYNRVGDIFMTPAALSKGFSFNGRKLAAGQHGFDNDYKEMQAVFYAWGPEFKEHQTIGNFENVNVYPLIAKMLGLSITEKIDGKAEVLENILK